ncbi:putative phycocyanobilin lyase [Synechococcus phage S-CBWM1]|uniref:Putative phycocyanobilin lyase n=1 Tax=Synechococcus phage S-CBWM1 TaxID=2053653 RepID=A0A3G1L3T9_9CAUD|nr:putative phycocyanobilin lyase [Synechococcus phage S-CBWM1]ATW62848.1 putative phycocyanobilin lyase [Synechococcus phage S-CBWM1]
MRSTESKLIKSFFIRTEGDWKSRRRYLYLKSGKTLEIETYFTIKSAIPADLNADLLVKISWESEEYGSGEMNCSLLENVLRRDSGYFTEDPTLSAIRVIDRDCIVLSTTYGGCRYREEIRLLEEDNIRLRQTVGWKEGDSSPFLCGQYFEERVED